MFVVHSPEKPRSERTGLTPTDAYFAGYIDADGCVRFSSGTPRIEVKSVFPWVLHQLQDRFGGSVTKINEEGERSFYRWAISGQRAQMALIQLEPHLIVKRAQAALVIQACRMEPGAYRDGVVAQISALKHHDYCTD